jgi:hypothetical protein
VSTLAMLLNTVWLCTHPFSVVCRVNSAQPS